MRSSGTSSSSSGQGGEGEGGGSVSMTSGTGGNNEGGCAAQVASDPQNCGACGRACRNDQRVAEPRCVDGVCESFCDSGFVNITKPGPGEEDDGCEAVGRRVFVTSQTFAANQLGGVSGADDRCQELANALKLGGSWRAWLSGGDGALPVAQRFNRDPAAPYKLLNGTQVAASWDDLIDPSSQPALDHPIDLTETLSPLGPGSALVWTGTTRTGLATGVDCGGWGNAVASTGTVGNCTHVAASWTQGEQATGILACVTQARLYCFEQ